MLRISWKDKSREIRNRIKIPLIWLMVNKKARKLKYFLHSKRQNHLQKHISKAKLLEGKRKRSDQLRDWNNIKECLGKSATKAEKDAVSREHFHLIVWETKTAKTSTYFD